jgi:acyl-coenzyme A synthetase/AMP-(fatty) acid ligase
VLQFLFDRFAEAGADPAFIWRDESYSYRWLLARCAEWRDRLGAFGVPPGAVVLLRGDFSPDAVAAFVGLLERRCAVAPVTTDTARWETDYAPVCEAEWLIDVSDRGAVRAAFLERSAGHPFYADLRGRQCPGIILFSSGSTGTSKAAVHDASRLLEKYQTRRQNLRTLAFLRFNHIGGVDTLFYSLSNASCLVCPDDHTPTTVCRLVEKHRVEVLPVAPAFLNLLALSGEYRNYDLRSLKYVTYGAEVMPEVTLHRCLEMFPGVTLMQKYGTTEVGTLRSKSRGSDSLWVKIGGEGYQTRVIDGCLQIRARSAMLGYLNAPQPFTEDGWFITGDLVEVDGEYFRILGRATDMINVGGKKVCPAEVENFIQQLENVVDVTVSGERNPIMGQIVCARVVVGRDEPEKDIAARIRKACRERLEPHKVPVKVTVGTDLAPCGRLKKRRRQEDGDTDELVSA